MTYYEDICMCSSLNVIAFGLWKTSLKILSALCIVVSAPLADFVFPFGKNLIDEYRGKEHDKYARRSKNKIWIDYTAARRDQLNN